MSDFQLLGMTSGRPSRPTTFSTNGLLEPNDTLRQAWSYVEPTVLAQVAAMIRQLRDPFFVLATKRYLHTNRMTIAQYFQEQYALMLAAIYGDMDTVAQAARAMKSERQLLMKRRDHPTWFVEATKSDRDYRSNEKAIATAYLHSIIEACVCAHLATGIIREGSEVSFYYRSGQLAIGRLLEVPSSTHRPRTYSEVCSLNGRGANSYAMNHELMFASNADTLLTQLMQIQFKPGSRMSDYADIIYGFMRKEDRLGLGLEWGGASQKRFVKWCADYGTRSHDDRFVISRRGN